MLCLCGAFAGSARADDAEQVQRAARQLAAAQLPPGLLDFDFDFITGTPRALVAETVDRVAFIGRQAGIGFVLAKYYGWSKDAAVVDPLVRLIQTLGSLSVPVGKSRVQRFIEKTGVLAVPVGRAKLTNALDRFGLLYQPVGDGRLVSYDGRYDFAWAGTTAMALLAELNYARATGDDRFAGLRKSWLAGLMALYVPGWGFRSNPTAIDRSGFADGEVWLALSTYAEMFPQDAEVHTVLRDYDALMIEIYSAGPAEEFFQWGMMSAAARFAMTSDTKFVSFIAAQSQHFVGRDSDWSPTDNSCSMVEGLASVARILSGHGGVGGADNDLVRRIRTRIDLEMTKNRTLQIGRVRIILIYRAVDPCLHPSWQAMPVHSSLGPTSPSRGSTIRRALHLRLYRDA